MNESREPNHQTLPRVLVVAHELSFLERLEGDPVARKIPITTGYTGEIGQFFLADEKQHFLGIFIDVGIPGNDFFSVVRAALFHRPATPIFLLTEPNDANLMKKVNLRQLGVRDALPKDGLTYKRMVECVSPITLGFDPDEAIRLARQGDSTGGEAKSEEYSAIRARDFLTGTKSFFDVYVRLGSDKFVKLLEAGDAFTPDRLEGYLKKGVTHFYIRKEVQESYVRYCDQVSTAILGKQSAPYDVKISQVLNHGAETLKFLQTQKVEDAQLRQAVQFLFKVNALTQQLSLEDRDHFRAFLHNAAAAEHATSCTMLSSILANGLEIRMDRPVQIVGAASFFHDIGLMGLPPELWDEDEGTMTPTQREVYRSHPELGSAALRDTRGFEPGALQAVEQHHMRKGGRGFPERFGFYSVNRVAEIVGIAGDFSRILHLHTKDPKLDVMAELEKTVLPYFSSQIVYAFRSAFFPAKHR